MIIFVVRNHGEIHVVSLIYYGQAPLELIDFLFFKNINSLMNNRALGCHMSKVINVKFHHDIQYLITLT